MIAEGSDLGSLFQASLEGMNRMIRQDLTGRAEELPTAVLIRLEAVDSTALLIDFLSEVLSLTHTNKAIYPRAEFSEISETRLCAQVYGVRTDRFDRDVKAVTYHEANVIRDENGNYRTVIIFDI